MNPDSSVSRSLGVLKLIALVILAAIVTSADPVAQVYGQSGVTITEETDDGLIARVTRLLEAGVSADVIFNHEASRGNAVFSVVNAAIIADLDRETEFRWTADILLGGFPATACGCIDFEKEDEWNEISYDALRPKTVAEAARVFFEDDLHLARLNEDFVHGLFPVAELAQILELQSLWYRILPVRNHPVANGVFVSIYQNEEEIIVDGNLGLVREAVDSGDEYMPVIFHYYKNETIPIGRYPEIIDSGMVSEILKDVDLYVNAPPNWKQGDFHAEMTVEEIENLVTIPEKDDIDPELWAIIETRLTNDGFQVPVILTSESGFSVDLHNSVETVSVAKEIGIELIPVVLFKPPGLSNMMSLCRRIIRDEFEDGRRYIANFGSGGPSLPPPPPDSPPPPPPPVTP